HHLVLQLRRDAEPPPAVAQRDRDCALCRVLPDDVPVELRDDLAGGQAARLGHRSKLLEGELVVGVDADARGRAQCLLADLSRGRFLPYSFSLPSNFSNNVKASAVAPANPASTCPSPRRRSFRAPCFKTTLSIVTWPSAPIATFPSRRTQTTVVERTRTSTSGRRTC